MNPAEDFMHLHHIFMYLDNLNNRYSELENPKISSVAMDLMLYVSKLEYQMLQLEKNGLVDK